MGRPFKQELNKLEGTYNWALSVPIDGFEDVRNSLLKNPFFVVGSGGSLSACILFALLQQYSGTIANAITPLELQYVKNALNRNTNIVFISASGKNTDILLAFENAIKKEPETILSICLKKDTPLSKKSSKYSIAKVIEFDNPAGKDGFLATNSLLAYFTIISRLYNQSELIKSIVPTSIYLNDLSSFSKRLHEDFTITVLYGGWGKPAAFDIESKFSEAGLGNILLTDYRNFGHGRHNWFDKKQMHSAIVALITPEEEELAKKTLGLLPKKIPVLIINTKYTTSNASIDLLIKSFYLVEEIGKLKNIDPGRPGVPAYGSKLYHLKYSQLYSEEQLGLTQKGALAISRKTGKLEPISAQEKHISLWNKAYLNFVKKINSTSFRGIILDYDGTICSSKERLSGPIQRTQQQLINFLKSDILIGIVTGRGQSARKDLQRIFPKKYWSKVVIGYYNGSQIGTLKDNDLPVTTDIKKTNILYQISQFLSSEPTIYPFIKEPTIRPAQLTIEVIHSGNSEVIKNIIIDSLKNKYPFSIQVLESSHSIDIIPLSTSKISIIQACHSLLNDHNRKFKFLCIGDKGKWPGNDYQLLSTEYSLSVDRVSSDPYTCWNLSSVGNNCVEATTEYFDAIKPVKSFFRIKL